MADEEQSLNSEKNGNNDFSKINCEIKSYEFDDLLRLTGGFGRYQLALNTLMCLVSIPTGAQYASTVFYGTSPRFICETISGNETCLAGKCCSGCVEYEFKGPFTSAVSEVW